MLAHDKLERLRGVLRGYGSALVCFSGGGDSTFLLKVAVEELGANCHAITADSPTLARSEHADALALAQEIGIGERHRVVSTDELNRPGFAENPVDRCAMCKTELMSYALPAARDLGLEHILLGTNTDDLGDHRPGIAAANQHGGKHPMVEAGLSKSDVRVMSKELGLRTWDKPQLACLSSRFPYGTRITPERLSRVDRFEDGLRKLGFSQLRVRFHDEIARVELHPDEMPQAMEQRQAIVDLGRACEFTFVAMDLAGYRSGSLNESLVRLKVKKTG